MRRIALGGSLLLGLALAAGAIAFVRGVDHDALWKIAHGECVPHEEAAHDPAPCALVDLTGGEDAGFVVLKDIVGRTHYLLIPTLKISGVEDPRIGAGALPNYWRAAWAARGFVEARAGRALPDDALAMAINAPRWRSQEQLHIHIDCLSPDARRALADHGAEIGEAWSDLPFDLAGQTFRGRRLVGETPSPDPFASLRADAAAQGAPMAEETLAVAGAPGGGFILLARRGADGQRAHAEDVLDRASCSSLPS